MIDIKDLLQDPEKYRNELQKRNGNPDTVDTLISEYTEWKEALKSWEQKRSEQNNASKKIAQLQGAEKMKAIAEMKALSESMKALQEVVQGKEVSYKKLLSGIPNITWSGIPHGKDDSENPVIKTYGLKPEFSFTPKPYYELEVYNKYVPAEDGVRAMGARGYYLRGEIARFRKVLFDWVENLVLSKGFEMFYPPLMLNEKVMTDIGNLPDFDGQLYEVPINENTNYYLIPSSEQSIMGYFNGKNLGLLDKPLLVMANTTCFRKEAGSYGKDQQGILRVHQFEKIEMDAIYKPEDEEKVFGLMNEICEEIYSGLGIHYRAVEICTGDMPHKHYRQIDFEGYFPGTDQFRELASNGAATDFQNRGLKITYEDGKLPWSNNCTGVTMRAMLAILEQNQNEDGSVRVPEVLVPLFGKTIIQ